MSKIPILQKESWGVLPSLQTPCSISTEPIHLLLDDAPRTLCKLARLCHENGPKKVPDKKGVCSFTQTSGLGQLSVPAQLRTRLPSVLRAPRVFIVCTWGDSPSSLALLYSDTLCLVLTSQECRSAFRLPLPQIFAGTIGSSNRRPTREGTPLFIISEDFSGGYAFHVSPDLVDPCVASERNPSDMNLTDATIPPTPPHLCRGRDRIPSVTPRGQGLDYMTPPWRSSAGQAGLIPPGLRRIREALWAISKGGKPLDRLTRRIRLRQGRTKQGRDIWEKNNNDFSRYTSVRQRAETSAQATVWVGGARRTGHTGGGGVGDMSTQRDTLASASDL
ncbi:hypothetical protein Bbelb_225000 [Branchiostoma belcheri]|nr:hypothetical protein Bbelb_225000 [Branchiostoma belcheri]